MGKKPARPLAAKARSRVAKGDATADIAAGGGSTVGSIVGENSNRKLADMEVYWMLFTRHPWIYQCVTVIADSVSAEGWEITAKQGDDAKPLSADDDPRVADIREFLEIAFSTMSERVARKSLAVDLETYGCGYWRKKRANGVLVGLERLDPRTVAINLNKARTQIDNYTIRKRDTVGGVAPMMSVETVASKDVIFFTLGGGDSILGLGSPLESLDLTLSFDQAARSYREAFFRSGARAGTILIHKGDANGGGPAQRQQVEAAVSMISKNKTGAYNAHKTWILTGPWEVSSVADAGKQDADFVKAWGLTREDVFGTYKVPIGMLTFSGSALGSAGKSEDQGFFETYAVLPLEEAIYETLTVQLLRDEFNITDLRLVPKRRNRVRLDRFDAAVQAVKIGFTGNEVRQMVGMPPISDPQFEMDVPLFIGAPTTGLAMDEPLKNVTPPPALEGQQQTSNIADAAGSQHAVTKAYGVARKAGRFRRPR